MGGYLVDTSVFGESEVAGPWVRYWARTFDTVLYALPTGLALALVFPAIFEASWIKGPGGTLLIGMLALPIVMIVDAVVISFFGTSPGKAIAGLRVQTLEHDKLGLEQALKRNLLVYLKGMFLGVPLFALIGYAKAHSDVKEAGFTTWDEDTDSRVFVKDPGEWRILLIGTLGIAAMVMDRLLAMHA